MNNMDDERNLKETTQCARIYLSKNEGGVVIYCENCNVVELEIGAISMRIESASLPVLRRLLSDATTRLEMHKQEKAAYVQHTAIEYSLH